MIYCHCATDLHLIAGIAPVHDAITNPALTTPDTINYVTGDAADVD